MDLRSLLLHVSVVTVANDVAMFALPFFQSLLGLVVSRSPGEVTRNRVQSSAEESRPRAHCFSVGVLGALLDEPARPVAEPISVGCHLGTMMGRETRPSAA